MTHATQHKVLILFLAMLAGTLSANSAEIQFKPAAELNGSLVLLGDIADIRATEPAEVEILKRIELFPSPGSGQSRMVSATYVRQLLQLHGVDAERHRFTGANAIRLASQESKSPASLLPPPVPAADAAEIVFTKRGISSGEIIREIDVELRTADKPQARAGVARTLEAVIGQEATRAFAAGQPLDPRSLRKPVLVERGQNVSVVARTAGVRAETTARALESGSRGDLITLESIDTHRKFTALVTGIQQAEVLAVGQMVSDSDRGRASAPTKQPVRGQSAVRGSRPSTPRLLPSKVAGKEQK